MKRLFFQRAYIYIYIYRFNLAKKKENIEFTPKIAKIDTRAEAN